MARVTVHDVARAAGASKSTVSRILNTAPSEDEGERAKAVRAAAQALGYVRDISAANLRLGRTGVIGVVLTNITETVRAMFFDEVIRVCRQSGRFAVAASIDREPGAERAAVEQLLRQGVDALILTTLTEGDTLPEELRERGVPFVLALRTDGVSPSAVGDDERGGYLAGHHLIQLGHRNIGVIGGPAGISTASSRIAGFKRALAEAGLSFPDAYSAKADFGAEAGARGADLLMNLAEPPTAIFAVNDTTAIGAIFALTRRGLKSPRDISIVGYSDIPLVRHLPVPLTTIRSPYDVMAADALALLEGGDEARERPVRLSAPSLIVRESTAPPLCE